MTKYQWLAKEEKKCEKVEKKFIFHEQNIRGKLFKLGGKPFKNEYYAAQNASWKGFGNFSYFILSNNPIATF